MDADEHDRMLASVSHLPHVLAFALVAHIAGQPDAQRKLALAGPGFRDSTRIAASSPAMWRDIALANRDAIGQELRALIAVLQRVDQALSAGDPRILQELFTMGRSLANIRVGYSGLMRARCDLFNKLQQLSLAYENNRRATERRQNISQSMNNLDLASAEAALIRSGFPFLELCKFRPSILASP